MLIQTLPPITKPAIRTQIEEIDGKDGDIITKLGYAAYDKEFTIGLSYGYDIDEIIAFFNSEGTVIFSNEDDKFYNYQIIEQIDFEKLIRFKTATVTMHVQPFKYSAIETTKTFNISNNLISFSNKTFSKNGVTLTATDGAVTITGTATQGTEFYMYITPVTLEPGNYILNAYSNGTNPHLCGVRLMYDSPTTANTFGGTYVMLSNNETVSISATLQAAKTYNYLYFYINPGQPMDFTVNIELESTETHSVTVRNNGNYTARPLLNIYGSGTVNIGLNNIQIFVINLGVDQFITIDTENLNAYKDGILKNRQVTGNYDYFVLNPGVNEVSYSGDITKITIDNYSRWI